MRPFETFAARPPYHIQGIAGGSEDLVIAFASIGHDPSRAPSPEFVRSATARDRSALFVMDEARSWATAEGFDAALRDHRHKAAVDRDSAMANAAGIGGTPAFVINGRFVAGAQPLKKFRRAVEQALADAK